MCQLAPDARALRLAVLPELRRVVGFDAYAWLLTDPATAVGASPLADVPWLPELPAHASLARPDRIIEPHRPRWHSPPR